MAILRSIFILWFSDFNERHLEYLAWAVLLQSICEGEGIVHLVVLEDIKTAIHGDFPVVVGHAGASMDSAGNVEFPMVKQKLLFRLFSQNVVCGGYRCIRPKSGL